MKQLRFSKKQLCRAIRAAVIAFILATCVRPAAATPPTYSSDYQVTSTSGGYSVLGSGTDTSAFFQATGSGKYTITIAPGAALSTTSSTSEIQLSAGSDATVTNSGSITGNIFGFDTDGTLDSLTNSGAITGTVVYGIYANTGIGSVTNSGQITGVDFGIFTNGMLGTVTNSGAVTGTVVYGIYANTGIGSVANSGQITGGAFGIDTNDLLGTLTNSGVITGTGVSGVDAETGIGSVTNSGQITGGDFGVYTNGTLGSLANTGTITGTSVFGVFGNTGIGSVTNSGQIIGGDYGVYTSGTLGSLANTGMITGTDVYAIYGGTGINSLTNSGQIIGGDYGVYTSGVLGPLTNSGSIIGTTVFGIYSGNAATITLNGGFVSGSVRAILVNGSSTTSGTSTVTINGRANFGGAGDIREGNGIGTLNLNLVGLTPAQITGLKAAATVTDNSYAINGTTYSWYHFNVNVNATSLEQVVAPQFVGLAQQIDNGGLPNNTGVGSAGAQFDPFFVEAASNPNGAFNTLTGLILTQGTQSLVTNTNQSLLSQWGSQLENNFGSTGGFDLTSFTMSSNKMAAFNDASTQLGHLVDLASTDAGPTLVPTTNNNRWGAWLTGNITVADSDGNTSSGQPGYHAVNGSPSIGFDYQVCPEWKVGALASASINGASFDDGSKIQSTTELLGLYTTYAPGNWRVHGIAAGGIAQYNNQRNAFGTDANSKPTGYDALAESTVGYEVPLGGGFSVTPELGLQYTHVNQGSYAENGAGALDLSVNRQDYDSLRTHLGAKLDKSFDITHDLKFMPEFRAAWYHEVLNQSHSVTSSLAGAPTIGSFSTQTSNPQRDYGLVGIGLNTAFTGYGAPVGLFLNYDAQVGQSDYIEHDVTGGIRVAF